MAANNVQAGINPAFEITRVVHANRQRVWRAWSEASELQHWWGPTGCTVKVLRMEFRPGGFFHYSMTFPDAPLMWGRFNYREIVTADRLVWLNSFSNEKCGIARAPFSELCPLEIENTATFTEHAGRTTISLRAQAFGEVAAERRYFDELRESMEAGYGGTLSQLEKHLA